MYQQLENINRKPTVFEVYTADRLWADPYISERMLELHLNPDIDVASRRRDFIERSIEWIKNYFSLNEKNRICDFGCGPGLYTLGLARFGIKVTGLDFSQNSIAYAKKQAENKNVDIRYHLGNYLEYKSNERYDLITMIMCDFCALSPTQRRHILGVWHEHLNAGGNILLDVYSLHAFEQREEIALYQKNLLDGFWREEAYYGFLNTFKYSEEKVVLDKYTIISDKKTTEVFNWLQYYDIHQLEQELSSAGFRIVTFLDNVSGGAYSGNGSEFAVVAQKI